eukprot:scaffold105405_cov24-Tisochrysis_lutea.AAC.1
MHRASRLVRAAMRAVPLVGDDITGSAQGEGGPGPLVVVHEDEDFVAVSKPPGQLASQQATTCAVLPHSQQHVGGKHGKQGEDGKAVSSIDSGWQFGNQHGAVKHGKHSEHHVNGKHARDEHADGKQYAWHLVAFLRKKESTRQLGQEHGTDTWWAKLRKFLLFHPSKGHLSCVLAEGHANLGKRRW